jgi:predicted AAA+ superfamily ATPase
MSGYNPTKIGLRGSVTSFRFSEDEGKLSEGLVFIELLRSGSTPFYWKKKKEVDFVVKAPTISSLQSTSPTPIQFLQENRKGSGFLRVNSVTR